MPIASSNFLIPNGTLIVELVAFLIVLGVIGKYVLPPLNKALRRAPGGRSGPRWRRPTRPRPTPRRPTTSAGPCSRRRATQAREIVAQANRTAEQVRADAQARGQAEYERSSAAPTPRSPWPASGPSRRRRRGWASSWWTWSSAIIGREVDAEAHRDLIDEAVARCRGRRRPAPSAAARRGAPVNPRSRATPPPSSKRPMPTAARRLVADELAAVERLVAGQRRRCAPP